MRTEENLLTLTLVAMFISMLLSVAALADTGSLYSSDYPSCTTLVDSEGEYAASFCSGGAKHLDDDAIDALANEDKEISIDKEWVD